jgi:hypothetical protein
MDRRAFFSLVRRGRLRVLELSCEGLHLRWVDARGRARTATEVAPPRAGIAAATATEQTALVTAEPPPRIAAPNVAEHTPFAADEPPPRIAVPNEHTPFEAGEPPTRIAAPNEHTPFEAGEPPTRIAAETAADLLASLDLQLANADVVRVTGREWLQEEELRRGVDGALEAFERRGGRVEHERHASSSLAGALALVLGLFVLGAAPATAQSSDQALRTRVEAAIAAAADLPADSISVQVRDGVVTLSGSVVCESCGGNATPGGAGTVQQSLGAVVRAIPGVADLRFELRYVQPTAR